MTGTTGLKALLLAAACTLPAAPALAVDAAPTLSGARIGSQNSKPSVLTPAERAGYRAIFDAIAASDWAGATAQLDGMDKGREHVATSAEAAVLAVVVRLWRTVLEIAPGLVALALGGRRDETATQPSRGNRIP